MAVSCGPTRLASPSSVTGGGRESAGPTSIAPAMRRRAWLRRKRLLLAAVTVATVGLGVLAYATDVLYPLEAQSIDARFAIRGSRPSLVKDLVVVAVDENTFNYFGALHAKNPSIGYQWPFPRR